jgi:AcrR family transcriptional regulator
MSPQISEHESRSRRRGDNLTNSIYTAVIEILRKDGYKELTFQSIARTARTSRAVLYRRWEPMFDLAHEFVRYKFARVLDGDLIDVIEDTGSLRGDLVMLLKLHQTVYTEIGREIMNVVLFEMSQNNNKVIELGKNAAKSNVATMQKLLEFAKNRGEAVKEVSDTTLVLPFNLLRMEYMFSLETVDESKIEKLVDEILLPVFKLY